MHKEHGEGWIRPSDTTSTSSFKYIKYFIKRRTQQKSIVRLFIKGMAFCYCKAYFPSVGKYIFGNK